MINFKNIFLSINSQVIFTDFCLEIAKGDKAAIKGRSGVGKTTIFNMIMGFVQPDSGEIYFEGVLLTQKNIRQVRKRISWLPQNPGIIGRGKIKEQILLPFTFHVNKYLRPDDKKIEEELEKLNLNKSILDSSFDEISGGEKQRLALMLCKLLKRDLMLLDEPTSALDKASLNTVVEYLCSQTDVTILSASHDDEWLRHCNKVVEI